MELGPPVCNTCMLIGKLDNQAKEHPWRCPCCRDFDLKGSLYTFISPTQKLVEIRTKIFESRIDTKMKIAKILHRRFMYPDDDRDPNERYRAWLEANVGKQGELWNWDITLSNTFDSLATSSTNSEKWVWGIAPSDTFDFLEISFANPEHALLFELSCP